MSPNDGPTPPVDPSRIATVLCDLDGVVWLAHRPIPGSVSAIAALRAGGRRVLFVTNNSAATLAQHEDALERIGVPAAGEVVSSATAAAQLIDPGERVLVTGGAGIGEAVESRRAVAIRNDGTTPAGGFDVVVVGLDRDFDYRRLAVAAGAVRAGARLIGTNTDPTYPTPDGAQPGGGSILAAVATASETTPIIAGKPHAPMAALIEQVVAGADGFDPRTVMMVGDRADTDGLMAARLGCPFALVRTGVAPPAAQRSTADARLDTGLETGLDMADLAAVAAFLGGR